MRALLSDPDYQGRSQSEHRAMLSACERGDADGAVTVLRAHLREGSQTLAAAVQGRNER